MLIANTLIIQNCTVLQYEFKNLESFNILLKFFNPTNTFGVSKFHSFIDNQNALSIGQIKNIEKNTNVGRINTKPCFSRLTCEYFFFLIKTPPILLRILLHSYLFFLKGIPGLYREYPMCMQQVLQYSVNIRSKKFYRTVHVHPFKNYSCCCSPYSILYFRNFC